jgi:two-component system, OmpR family, KDP operon response regulator KdpE
MSSGLVLVIEDEDSNRSSLCACLQLFGFEIVKAARPEDAISLVLNNPCDAVLLDLDIPGMSGADACKNLRATSSDIPILAFTGHNSEDEKVEVLNAGANDCITKPFPLRELVARIRAAMRWPRMSRAQVPAVLRIGDIELDVLNHRVRKANCPVHLTPMEYTLTYQLMIAAGRSIPYTKLMKILWGPKSDRGRDSVRTFVHQLRGKLESDPANPQYLLTVPQFGYRFARRV